MAERGGAVIQLHGAQSPEDLSRVSTGSTRSSHLCFDLAPTVWLCVKVLGMSRFDPGFVSPLAPCFPSAQGTGCLLCHSDPSPQYLRRSSFLFPLFFLSSRIYPTLTVAEPIRHREPESLELNTSDTHCSSQDGLLPLKTSLQEASAQLPPSQPFPRFAISLLFSLCNSACLYFPCQPFVCSSNRTKSCPPSALQKHEFTQYVPFWSKRSQ